MNIFCREKTPEGLGAAEIKAALLKSLEGRTLNNVLILPPDFTRFHSNAGLITQIIYHELTSKGCKVDIMPALGTHVPVSKEQWEKMFGDMRKEYEKGNYVICGGDFNHDFTGNSKERFNGEVPAEYSWAAAFPDQLIPAHFQKLVNYQSGGSVPSCRNCDKPYSPDSFVLTVDGFIVSDNVETTYMDIIDNQFLYSDHNPVKLKFKLKSSD